MLRSTIFLLLLLLVPLTGCAARSTPPQPAPSPTPVTLPATQSPATGAPTAAPASSPTRPRTCAPTHDDGVSPSYQPNAPVRAVVGKGHVLTGVVRSSRDCAPIANVRLEFWPEIGSLGHPDAARATLFTGADGRYRFECDPPDHIHMRISAPGYRTIGVNSYHPEGKVEGTLEIVLQPEP